MFIVFEGLDGSGKTTQARLLVERLRKVSKKAVYLKEPTDGEWGRKIRRIASEGREHLSPEDELRFFINDRAEDVEKNIMPALENGVVVVMDRYYFSNMAYQSALGVDIREIIRLNAGFPKPDMVFFIEIAAEDGLERIGSRAGGANVGYEKIEFLKKVHEAFERPELGSMIRLDGKRTVEEISGEIWGKVSGAIG
jgi:dTMP kinase